MKSQKLKPVAIVQAPEKPLAHEIIAQGIIDISKSFRAIQDGRLNNRAIALLVHAASSGVSMTDVKAVLAGLDRLEAEFIKPKRLGA